MSARPRFALFMILFREAKRLFSAIQNQKVGPVTILAGLIFVLAVAFFFISGSPILSPFVYPLF